MELISMRVINELKMTEPVQACIKIIAGHYQLAEKDIFGLNLALEEAMANVIKYGFDQEQQHYFDVAVEVDETAFTVVIRDKGIPGDFIEDPYDDGLGLSIMKHFLDQLIVKNKGFDGREQRLVKYLTGLPEYTRRAPDPPANLPAIRLADFPGIAEMGMGVVKKKYRNFAVMKNLSDQIAAYCEAAADINAILVEPVAWHPITQKMCPHYGFIPCGFAFNITDLANLDYQRASLCLAI